MSLLSIGIYGPLRYQLSYGPTKRCAGKFSERGPTESSAARENHVFWGDADYAWGFFYDT